MFTCLGALALALALGVWLSAEAFAAGPFWYVSPTGNDGNTCLTPAAPCGTIQAAVGKASPGNTIFVASGTYTSSSSEVVSVTKMLSFSGGWDAATFTIQNGTTTVDGQGVRRGISVTVNAPTTIISFTIQNGQSSGLGGGIFADTGSPLTLTNVSVINNTSAYSGGGLFAWDSVTLNGGFFQKNTSSYNGGGLFAASSLTMTGTQFFSNTSANSGGGLFAGGPLTVTGTQFFSNTAGDFGGGLYAADVSTLNGGLFQQNVSSLSGGGLFAGGPLTVTGAQFIRNTAQDGAGLYGAGRFAASVTLNGGFFQQNVSSLSGGGLFAGGPLTMTGTQFFSNTAQNGAGVVVRGTAILSGDLFQQNASSGNGGGLYADGVYATHTLTGIQFLSNTAQLSGGGLYVPQGGAGVTILNGGLFQQNASGLRGGGLHAFSILALTDTQFLRNAASDGGGLYHNGGTGRIVNALFAGNTAVTERGTALSLASPGSVQVLNTTIAHPSSANGAAVEVDNGSVGITNTIIVSHSVGISQAAGIVYQDYNLFFGNGTNVRGSVMSGGNSLIGYLDFVNAAGDNYHLGPASWAIDRGTNVGVTNDFEGDLRPQQGGFDIGYDESPYAIVVIFRLFLPLVVK